jgi:hypothetical protein
MGNDDRRWARDEEQIVLDFGGVGSSLQGSSPGANQQNGGGGISSCATLALLRGGGGAEMVWQ